jgi:hypothetical protein
MLRASGSSTGRVRAFSLLLHTKTLILTELLITAVK